MANNDLYREEILEHWQNPQNFGVIKGADLVIEQVNPLCGDEVTFFFRFEKARNYSSNASEKSKKDSSHAVRTIREFSVLANARTIIKDVKFTGSGCAISMASASILSEKIKGKSIDVISKITGEDILEFIGGSLTPARLKCAFLALEVIKRVTSDKQPVTGL